MQSELVVLPTENEMTTVTDDGKNTRPNACQLVRLSIFFQLGNLEQGGMYVGGSGPLSIYKSPSPIPTILGRSSSNSPDRTLSIFIRGQNK